MRFLMIAGAATMLLLPVAAPAHACGGKHSAQAVSTDYSAETKKPVKKVAKAKKEKVEYMRSAAGPEPTVKKTKKK
jgi:hypothetical protein